MTERSRHPAYAILGGRLHRQDLPGGRWTMLDDAETARLLALLAGTQETVETLTKAVHVHYIQAFEDYGIGRDVVQADPDVYHGARDTIAATLRSLMGIAPTAEDRLPTADPGDAGDRTTFPHPV